MQLHEARLAGADCATSTDIMELSSTLADVQTELNAFVFTAALSHMPDGIATNS